MDERLDRYITKRVRGMDVFRNLCVCGVFFGAGGGGAVVKWVKAPHTMVAFLWELYRQTGGEGGMVGTPKRSAPIIDINNIHTEL